MSEQELLETIIQCAHALNYLVAHFRPARTAAGWRTPVSANGKGFPDLVCVRPWFSGKPRTVYIELKSRTGRLSNDQRTWRMALIEAGNEYYLWRPADWLDGTVERVLSGEL